MTYSVDALSVEDAYVKLSRLIRSQGRRIESRAGSTIEIDLPVATTFHFPNRRVFFSEYRDWPVFFNFFEFLWMINGRRDVAYLEQFNSNMKLYSDDGKSYHAAYGYRWRHHFGFDQIEKIINHLTLYPNSRRAILQMWDPVADLDVDSKDLPCNMSVKFEIRDRKLNCIVMNRSNDLIYGLTCANSSQFGFLLEYMAARLNVFTGIYIHFSSNLHVYTDVWNKKAPPLNQPFYDIYHGNEVLNLVPLFANKKEVENKSFERDLNKHFSSWEEKISIENYETVYFRTVVDPMYRAFLFVKSKQHSMALSALAEVAASDWRIAAIKWVERRMKGEIK